MCSAQNTIKLVMSDYHIQVYNLLYI